MNLNSNLNKVKSSQNNENLSFNEFSGLNTNINLSNINSHLQYKQTNMKQLSNSNSIQLELPIPQNQVNFNSYIYSKQSSKNENENENEKFNLNKDLVKSEPESNIIKTTKGITIKKPIVRNESSINNLLGKLSNTSLTSNISSHINTFNDIKEEAVYEMTILNSNQKNNLYNENEEKLRNIKNEDLNDILNFIEVKNSKESNNINTKEEKNSHNTINEYLKDSHSHLNSSSTSSNLDTNNINLIYKNKSKLKNKESPFSLLLNQSYNNKQYNFQSEASNNSYLYDPSFLHSKYNLHNSNMNNNIITNQSQSYNKIENDNCTVSSFPVSVTPVVNNFKNAGTSSVITSNMNTNYDYTMMTNEIMDSFYTFKGNLSRDIRYIKKNGSSYLNMTDIIEIKDFIKTFIENYKVYDNELRRLSYSINENE